MADPSDVSDIKARLNDIENRIRSHREKLELHGIFDRGHQLTDRELRKRWSELKEEIARQTGSTAALAEKTSALDRHVHKWINALDLDFKT